MKYVIRLIAILILAIIILLFVLIKTTLLDNYIKNIIIYTVKLYSGYNVTISSIDKSIDSKTRICLSGIYVSINDNYSINIDNVNFWFNTFDAITNALNSVNYNIKHVRLYSKDSNVTPLIDSTFRANMCYDKSTRGFLLFLNIDDLNHELLGKVNNYLTDIIKESSYIISINSDGILELISMLYTTSEDNHHPDTLLKAHCNVKLVDSDLVNVQVKIDGSDIPETHTRALRDLIIKSNNYHDITNNIDIGSIARANINFDLESKFSDVNNINVNNLSGSLLLNSASIELQRGVNTNAVCNTVHVNFTDDKLHLFIPEWHLLSTTASDTTVDIDLNSQDIELRIEGTAQGPVMDLINSLADEKATSKLQALNIDLSKSAGTAKTKFLLMVPLDNKRGGQYEVVSNIDNFILPIWNNKFILSYDQVRVNYNNRQLDIYTHSDGKINNMCSKLRYLQIFNDTDKPDDQALNVTFALNRDSNLGYNLPYITDGEAVVNLEYQSQLGKPSVQITSDLTNLQFALPYKLISKDIGHTAHLQASIDINDPNNKIITSMELNGNNNLNVKSIIEYSKSAIKFNFPTIRFFDNDFEVEGNYANKLYNIKIHGKTIRLESDSLLDFSKNDGANFSILLNNTVVINLAEVVIDNKIYLNKLYFVLLHPGGVRADGRLSVSVGNNIINGVITSNEVNEAYKCTIDAKNAGAILRALHISPNLQSGIFKIELDIPKDESGMINGAVHMKNFATKHTSFLTHLVAFLSLPGLYHFLILKNIIHFTKMDIKFDYNQGIIRILEGDVIGRSLSFDIHGIIDLQNKIYDVKGMCTPSIYGINDIIKMISNKYHIKNSF